ncbi:hypothetical protein [Saccharopolyspora halophila]|uniref:hypothetical protein n=1 Tax=Saccharopolyspora halophila TaxID=405551 RepID=UPI0031DEEEC0
MPMIVPRPATAATAKPLNELITGTTPTKSRGHTRPRLEFMIAGGPRIDRRA